MTSNQAKTFHHATQLLETDQPRQAIREFTALYQEIDTPVVNQQLVRALMADQQFAQALQVAHEQQEEYLQSPDLTALLCQVELANSNFIAARQLAIQQPKLLPEVSTAEQIARQQTPTTIQARLKHFFHLGDGGLVTQQRGFAAAQMLPLDEFVQGSRFVLRDPFVLPLIKSTLLQTLASLQVTDRLTYLWLDDHEYQVVPAQIPDLETLPAVQAVVAELKRRFAQDDPITYQTKHEEFQLQLTLLYPRVAEVIIDPSAWVVALCQPRVSATDETSAARDWQEKLGRLIQQMMP